MLGIFQIQNEFVRTELEMTCPYSN